MGTDELNNNNETQRSNGQGTPSIMEHEGTRNLYRVHRGLGDWDR